MDRKYINEYIELYEKYNHNISRKFLTKNYPHIYNEIQMFKISDMWGEMQYNYIHNIKEIPICPICGKTVGFVNFKNGYRKFCSHKCNVINNSKINTKTEYTINKNYVGLDVYNIPNSDKIIIKGVCNHEIHTTKHMLDIYYSNGSNKILEYPLLLCDVCMDEYIKNTQITSTDIRNYIQTNNVKIFNKRHIQYRDRLFFAMLMSYNKDKQYDWDRLTKSCTNTCIDCGIKTLNKRCDDCDRVFKSNTMSVNNTISSNIRRSMTYKLCNFDINTSVNKDRYILQNYCKHGDIEISKINFNHLYNHYGYELNHNTYIICNDCLRDYKIQHTKDKNNHGKLYDTEYMNRLYNPILHKIIDESYTNDFTFQQKKFMYVNNIQELPMCKVCGKNHVEIHKNNNSLLMTCKVHRYHLYRSKLEIEVEDFIREIYEGDIISSYRYAHNKEIDIFLPQLSIGFEFNGLYWHGENRKEKDYHINKYKELQNDGIQLITIWEDDWKLKQDIIKSIIYNKINKNNRIYARKCSLKEISNKEAKQFLDDNHIQGYVVASYSYALLYNNEIVSIMTFTKPRMVTNSLDDNGFELLRFCSKKYITVVGGASKLLSHFIKIHNPQKIISYANCDISDGDLYKKLGFIFITHTTPNYWWVVKGKREHRAKFMKHKLVSLGFDKNLTEVEIMHNNGNYRIFGNGNLKYEIILH